MRILCIIPARGGSKRIPHKNIIDFMGMPLIGWSIRAARQSGCFAEVMVSTDSPDIAQVAMERGAKVPFLRSAATANDFATTADVIEEVLARYEERGEHFDAFCCLYATAPFVMPFRLKNACEKLQDENVDGAFTVIPFSYPPQRGLILNDEGCVAMLHPEFAKARSQDLQKIYHDAGQFYVCKTEAFRRERTLWCKRTAPIILPEEEAQDIDTYSDLKMAKVKFENMKFPERFETEHYSFISYAVLTEEELRAIYTEYCRPGTYSMMRSNRQPSFEEHCAYAASIKNRLEIGYYIVKRKDCFATLATQNPGEGFDEAKPYADGELLGAVNATMRDDRTVERGIFMAEAYKGKGLAKSIVTEFYGYLKARMNIEQVLTEVLPENAASNALERSLGAEFIDIEQGFNVYKLKI